MVQTYSERTEELREQVKTELYTAIGKSQAFDELVNRRVFARFPSLDDSVQGHLRGEIIASVWHELVSTFI